MSTEVPHANETDPAAPHHFVFTAYVVRRGPGKGRHGGMYCNLCSKELEDPIHDYEDPLMSYASSLLEKSQNAAVGNDALT